MTFGGLFLGVWAAPELATIDWTALPPDFWLEIGYLALLPTAVGLRALLPRGAGRGADHGLDHDVPGAHLRRHDGGDPAGADAAGRPDPGRPHDGRRRAAGRAVHAGATKAVAARWAGWRPRGLASRATALACSARRQAEHASIRARQHARTAACEHGSAAARGTPSDLERALQGEQRDLAVHAAGVAGEGAAGADHAVAGHDDADRVAADRGTDRPGGLRLADARGDVAVGRGRAERDRPQLLPDRELEGGAGGVERQVERPARRPRSTRRAGGRRP